jgi:hypothetical protein
VGEVVVSLVGARERPDVVYPVEKEERVVESASAVEVARQGVAESASVAEVAEQGVAERVAESASANVVIAESLNLVAKDVEEKVVEAGEKVVEAGEVVRAEAVAVAVADVNLI